MSTHEVLVYQATIQPHPNADAIELCAIGGYVSIVRKGEFKTGDLVAYIPEASIVPVGIIEYLGLVGKLSGSAKNRVKAIKLRGVLSQGLIYRPPEGYKPEDLGKDVAEQLGIEKWEPPIPAHLRGKVKGAAYDITVAYDIENIKKWNRHFIDGEMVAITEKIHGTNVQVGYCPIAETPQGLGADVGSGNRHFERSADLLLGKSQQPTPAGNEEPLLPSKDAVPISFDTDTLYEGRFWVTSKGLGKSGLILDCADAENLYVKIASSEEFNLFKKLEQIYINNKEWFETFSGMKNPPVALIGEIFGPGVQAGFSYGQKVQFRLFDIAVGTRNSRKYVSWDDFCQFAILSKIPTVPILHIGPYSEELVTRLTSGKETVSGKELHMREGCVVKPLIERESGNLGRVILKSISPEYLTRKGTEEELTEFQ